MSSSGSGSDIMYNVHCFNISGLYIMFAEDLQIICICASILALLLPLITSLIIFSTRKLRHTLIFQLSLLSACLTVVMFAITLQVWMTATYADTSAVFSDPSRSALRTELARRFLQQTLPWMWDVILLLKLLDFYPRTMDRWQWKRYLILSIPFLTKFRLAFDFAAYGLTIRLQDMAPGDRTKSLMVQAIERKLYFSSVVLRTADDIVTSTLLIYKAFEFYRDASVPLSATSRAVRFIVEGTLMSSVGMVPIDIALTSYFGRLLVKSQDKMIADSAQLLIFLSVGLSAVFGLFGSVWSSIGGAQLAYMRNPSNSSGSTGPSDEDNNAIPPNADAPVNLSRKPSRHAPPVDASGVGADSATETMLSIFYVEPGHDPHQPEDYNFDNPDHIQEHHGPSDEILRMRGKRGLSYWDRRVQTYRTQQHQSDSTPQQESEKFDGL